MATCTANWEDEETNRIVELWVEYETHGERVQVESVTPAAITFLDPATKSPVRKIKIWTTAGRRMLLAQYAERVGMSQLDREVAQNQLVAAG